MKITIIGLGLIGGSIAAASKHANVGQIAAYDQNLDALEYALQAELIDRYEKNISDSIKDADIIVIAVPPEQFVDVLQQIQPAINDRQIITDTLSVKSFVNDAAKQILGKRVSQFVAGHPIAGSEKSGVRHAKPELFTNHSVILSPFEETDTKAVQQIEQFWQNMGAKTFILDATKHDELLATTSHLPHILSFAFSQMFIESKNKDEAALCCAGSFNDMTRIATGSSNLWADIFIHNHDAILASIDNFEQSFKNIKQALQDKDKKNLLDTLELATAVKKWRKK